MIVNYLYLGLASNIFINILGVISIILIIKDFIYPIPKDNCKRIKNR